MKTTFTGNTRLRLALGLAGLLAFVFVTPRAYAQESDQPAAPADQPDQPNQPDPPSRAARISYVEGSVSFQPGGSGDWGAAALNRPTTVGDKIWSDKDSRAELQVGEASIHMGSMTALSFLNLDENIMQVRVPEGAINFRVRELREGDLYEVDTPNLAFTVKQAGAFRVEVSEDGGATRVIAIRGEGEVTAGGKTYPVRTGEMAEFNGIDNPEYQSAAAPPPDGLDRWAADRDLREDNSVSARYVSREVPGYSDLDQNGTWNEEPDTGPVWYPNDVPVGWAPYSYGYWNWVGPWGWTWIGYEPWGYAPFHYGRWGFIGGRWGWCPGPYYGRPFFGPAFVGFLGGPGFGFGVGWFPLGFHEPFYPGFHASRGFINNINTRNTFIRNVNVLNTHSFNYAYAHNVNAVTATSRNAFVGGQAINRGATHLTDASLRGASVSNHAAFSPTRQSSFGAANLNGHIATPPASIQNRSVMARTAPGAAASHMPVRTMNTTGLTAGRAGGSYNSYNGARQNQLSQSRPSYAGGANNSRVAGATNGRVWSAQGNTTDSGKAPQGFGSDRQVRNGSTQTAMNRTDRPPWAGSGAASRLGGGGSTNANNGRTYQPPARTYSAPRSSYPTSRPSYSAPAPRSYSAPSRTYSAPSHSYSAPSHSSGGSSHSSGGGSHGGGGGSHGGGGGSHGGHH